MSEWAVSKSEIDITLVVCIFNSLIIVGHVSVPECPPYELGEEKFSNLNRKNRKTIFAVKVFETCAQHCS